jgi:hypothetical protein
MDFSQLSKLVSYFKANTFAPVDLASQGVYSAWKHTVPSNVRFAAQTLYGNRNVPFTNEDLTDSELQGYSDIIKQTEQKRKDTYPSLLEDNQVAIGNINKELLQKQDRYNKLPKETKYWTEDDWTLFQEFQDLQKQRTSYQNDYDIAKRRLDNFKQGKGDIQYKDYQNYNNPTQEPRETLDSSINLANTIGRFNYQQTPQGYNVKDRWDFNNKMDLPMVKKYQEGGYPAVFKDVWDSRELGNLPVGLAIQKLGYDGRDINLNIPK